MKINQKVELKDWELVEQIRMNPQDVQKSFFIELFKEFADSYELLESIYDNDALSNNIVEDLSFFYLFYESNINKDRIKEITDEETREIELEKEELENSINELKSALNKQFDGRTEHYEYLVSVIKSL